ncbi:hypothetical protein C4D60_Mb00t07510 [Musa balbisiana]|uniref:Uncharacterized protein n=1 Tax=Musa balbisiana TaxID=52838 RepID=A0A4S8I5C6_MUSBA|nr:hypothetical protein C4D60_Mb00t07510 [Musa balbisiana]
MQSKGERRLGSERQSSHGGWQRWWVGWAATALEERGVLGGCAAAIDEGLRQQRKLCFCNRCKEGCGNRRLRLRPKGWGAARWRTRAALPMV